MRILLLGFALALCACNKDSPPTPTPEQSAQLNESENMLNDLARNAEGPEANASGPSNSSG
jgi:hypothetical protein